MPRTGDNPFFKGANRTPSLIRVSSPQRCPDQERRPSTSSQPTLPIPSSPSLTNNEFWESAQPFLTASMTWSQRYPSMCVMLDTGLEEWQAVVREMRMNEADMEHQECAIDDSDPHTTKNMIPKPLVIQKTFSAAISSSPDLTLSKPPNKTDTPISPSHLIANPTPPRPRRPSPHDLPTPSDFETLDQLFTLNPSNQLTPQLPPPPNLFKNPFTLHPSLHPLNPSSPSPPISPLTTTSILPIHGSLARNHPLPTKTTLSEIRQRIRKTINKAHTASSNQAASNNIPATEALEPRLSNPEQGPGPGPGPGQGQGKEQEQEQEQRTKDSKSNPIPTSRVTCESKTEPRVKQQHQHVLKAGTSSSAPAPRLPRTMSLQRLSMGWSSLGSSCSASTNVDDDGNNSTSTSTSSRILHDLKSKVSFRDLTKTKTHGKRAEGWDMGMGMGGILCDREIGVALRSSV